MRAELPQRVNYKEQEATKDILEMLHKLLVVACIFLALMLYAMITSEYITLGAEATQQHLHDISIKILGA